MGEKRPLLNMDSERNVVILGAVGSGKRTLGNYIVGENIFQQASTTGTGNANHHFKQHWAGDTLYRILIVDTKSVQISYSDPLPFIRYNFQVINLIIFVVANGRYTDETHNSLMRVVQGFDMRAKPFSTLFITHCEGMTDEIRRARVEEFKDESRSSEVAAFIGKRMLTVGLPDISKVSPNLKEIYQKGIAEDEKAIKLLVKECKEALRVQDLQTSICERIRRGFGEVCTYL